MENPDEDIPRAKSPLARQGSVYGADYFDITRTASPLSRKGSVHEADMHYRDVSRPSAPRQQTAVSGTDNPSDKLTYGPGYIYSSAGNDRLAQDGTSNRTLKRHKYDKKYRTMTPQQRMVSNGVPLFSPYEGRTPMEKTESANEDHSLLPPQNNGDRSKRMRIFFLSESKDGESSESDND